MFSIFAYIVHGLYLCIAKSGMHLLTAAV